jgi:hypothetical protein
VGKISLARRLRLLNTPASGLKNGKIRMATGTLKMWNVERGYGFIGDDAGGPDVFLHVSALAVYSDIRMTSCATGSFFAILGWCTNYR